MRRQLRAFRPWLSEVLEARAVPATLGVSTPIGVLGIKVNLPSQVPTTSTQVQNAFTAFDQSYINAVDTILLAPNSNGLSVPTANRAAFNAAVEQSLETLAQQLVLSVTSTTTTGSTSSSSVSNQVVAAIVGTSSTSLESQLLAVSTTTIQLDVATVTSTSTSTSTTLSNAVSTVEQVRPTTRVPDAESTGSATFSTSTSSASASASTIAANQVRSAFGNFLNDYFQAVQNTLLAPGASGQANPTASRAAFNAEVNQAIQTLETRLTTTLSQTRSTAGLGPQVLATLEGNGGSSLKSQLTNLATPSGTEATVVRDFTLGSTQAIAQALSLISGDVAAALSVAGK
jgi:hypothetical protein